jgi:S-DNA-T family DNA segregation ATPase FtsK/SpoIIIE
MATEVCTLAKKRKRKNRVTTISFEVYGILILIFSVITLAGQGPISGMGTVGRAINYICLFLAGQMNYVIPLIAIYVGLYVMIKRQWPSGWSYRRTGIVLLLIGILTLFQISMTQDLYPAGDYKAGSILNQPMQNILELLDKTKTVDQFNDELGGGMIGAIVFSGLYIFFDEYGSQLFVYALLAIGFLYLTGWSYVDMGARIKRTLGLIGKKGGRQWKEIFTQLERKKQQRQLQAPQDEEDDEEDEVVGKYPILNEIDEENHQPSPKRKSTKKSLFMELLKPDKGKDKPNNDFPDELSDTNEIHASSDRTDNVLLVRDFMEHVDQTERRVEAVAANISAVTPAVVEGGESNIPPLYAVKERVNVEYKLPPFHLLSKPASAAKGGLSTDYKANARKLETTLESFGVRAKVMEVVRGPAVTRYEILPDVGVKVSRIVSLTDDIALALAAKDIRMEAPIPGKSAIGIEVPNTEVSIVTVREVMESASFHESQAKLSIVLGRDISGQPMVANLARMPHLLVAGATGSGKSVCINAIIVSILYKAKPDEVKFLMIDPKMVELNIYNGIPHLLAPVVTDPRRASLALKKVVVEMEKRYELFSKSGSRNIEGYNNMCIEKGMDTLPFIVVIVDELADLMMVAAHDVEDAICRLAQMARAAGIHLIIATQRPSVDVITGVIKANIPSRIAFGVSSQVDSRTILDGVGAEKLLGRGDMLYLPVGESKPIRVQGAFLSDPEVEAVVQYARSQGQAQYQEDLVPEVEEQIEMEDPNMDELYDQAAQIVLEAKQASVSLLQRRLRIGYTRAARLIDYMEASGVIGPYEGSKPREVLMTFEQFQHSRMSS